MYQLVKPNLDCMPIKGILSVKFEIAFKIFIIYLPSNRQSNLHHF